MNQPHISLAAETIGSVFGLPVTNSILMTWIVMAFLIGTAFLATRSASLIPNSLQSVFEVVLDGLYSLFKSVVGEENVERFFPLLATIFLFVICANWAGLVPGVGSIGFTHKEEPHAESMEVSEEPATGLPAEETELDTHGEPVMVESDTHDTSMEKVEVQEEAHESVVAEEVSEEHAEFVPLFRGATADLNTTLAIAIIAVIAVQYYGVRTLGAAYFKKFFNLSDPIMFGVGLLEIISEFSRIISFAFRLFGNIFAGEVLLTVIAFLMPLVAPLPFLGLELFVGFIQALVFAMLTAVFLNMATMSHESH